MSIVDRYYRQTGYGIDCPGYWRVVPGHETTLVSRWNKKRLGWDPQDRRTIDVPQEYLQEISRLTFLIETSKGV